MKKFKLCRFDIFFLCHPIKLDWILCNILSFKHIRKVCNICHLHLWTAVGVWTSSIEPHSVCLKVSLSRAHTFWASLLCCTVVLINAFFHWTSQHKRCSSADGRYTQHSHKNKQLSLATSTNLCGMLMEWLSRHSVAPLFFKAEMCLSTKSRKI